MRGVRISLTANDQLFLVPITQSAGNLTVGPPRLLSSSALSNYLPAVAVLANGEVGILFLTMNPTTFSFQWRFVQWTNGSVLAKTTGFPSFSSPVTNNGNSRQRIFGDYIQLRAVGCNFYGTSPAAGAGPASASSIDPYFMSAPSFNACALP